MVILRQVAGYACLLAGGVGCLLPVLPGIPLLIAGLGLLSVDSPWAARLHARIMSKLRKKPVPSRDAA
ncbi:MAG: hypothetical protein IRZ03_00285 [Acidobacterium ailaaui]|nr:hypothetical protein [Pseudacidobacterium ailaaui]